MHKVQENLTREGKQGENCIKNGVKCLKIASLWVRNLKNNRNAQYIPLCAYTYVTISIKKQNKCSSNI